MDATDMRVSNSHQPKHLQKPAGNKSSDEMFVRSQEVAASAQGVGDGLTATEPPTQTMIRWL